MFRCARLSPALVDVDAVDFVGTNGDLGQRLDHMVTLQDDVALSTQEEKTTSVEKITKKTRRYQRAHDKSGLRSHLLFVVVTGHVQNKQAVAQ